jgi:hypothetical protein
MIFLCKLHIPLERKLNLHAQLGGTNNTVMISYTVNTNSIISSNRSCLDGYLTEMLLSYKMMH